VGTVTGVTDSPGFKIRYSGRRTNLILKGRKRHRLHDQLVYGQAENFVNSLYQTSFFGRWCFLYSDNTIKIVNKAIKTKLHKNNVLQSLHSLESSLSYLKYYRLKLKKKLKQNLIWKMGGKLSTNLNRNCSNVKWENIESAFNGRIRTGFISTLNIKDPLIVFNKTFKLKL
jgi:hypothetical protein